MSNLRNKTIVITGAGRGIGQAIALKFASAGANIVVLSKEDAITDNHLVTDQIIAAGGQALVLNVDVCDALALKEAITEAIGRFGTIDGLVNNTSATCFNDMLHTTADQFDLLIATSVRAAFLLSALCVPYLKLASNPHIINISPPLHMEAGFFKEHLGFSIGKYGMSLCTLGMAEEFKKFSIAVNSLWPQTTIATQTIKDHFSHKVYAGSRWPSIMADAAYELILRKSNLCTGHFFTDEGLLREKGIKDFSSYAVDPHATLMQALFIPVEENRQQVSQDLFLK